MFVKCQPFGRLSEMLVIVKVAQDTCNLLEGHHGKQGVRASRGEGLNNSSRAGILNPGKALESSGSFEILFMPRPHSDQLPWNGATLFKKRPQ